MRILTSILITTFLLANTSFAAETWTPVVAKHRLMTIRVDADGSEKVVNETRGSFLRSSSGRELRTKAKVVDGVEQEASTGMYVDKATGKKYELSYRSKVAILRDSGPSPELTEEYLQEARRRAIGEKTINGIPCLGFPIVSGSDGSVVGVGWRSLEYDLHVKMESEHVDGGHKMKTVSELYDIQLGVEPPADAVRIPSDFKVIEDTRDLPGLAP